jgi:hypothetical protein
MGPELLSHVATKRQFLQSLLNHFLPTAKYKMIYRLCKLLAQCEYLIYTRLGGCEIVKFSGRH